MPNFKITRQSEAPTERLVGWLRHFADQEADKHGVPEVTQDKEAHHLDNILNVLNRNKKQSVEEKVAKYRELVGLDLVNTIDNIEKEGEGKFASIALSIHAKQASNKYSMDDIKEYIKDIIANSNGTISAPALSEQLHKLLGLDQDWLNTNQKEIMSCIDKEREAFRPKEYEVISVHELSRTDEPNKNEKEPPLFAPPNKTGM